MGATIFAASRQLAYGAMAVPTILAGWAATVWGLAAVFPWFSLAVALACVLAGTLGLRSHPHRTAVEAAAATVQPHLA